MPDIEGSRDEHSGPRLDDHSVPMPAEQAVDIAHAVLVRVARFVRSLSDQQVRAIASGAATLRVVDATADAVAESPTAKSPAAEPLAAREKRPVRRGASARRTPTAGATAQVDPDQVRQALAAATDRRSAAAYLDALGLTVPQLRALAIDLGLAVPSGATKTVVRDTIVQWTAGRRIDGMLLARPETRLG